MVHRTTETDWQSLYEAETRISARQAAEIVQLRELVDLSTDKAIAWDTVAGKNARIAKLRYAIIGYLEVFDRCGGSEAVSPDTFAAARQQLRESLSFTSNDEDP